ncbi:MAG: DUF4878 domain-containing protein [Bacteroidetes bacterium]|nr:DUF4878 domain-containing protein [Bacteroidota bacterium]
MKKLFKVALVLLAVIAMNACNNSADTPESVAESFLNHLGKKEYEEAAAYGTEATKKYINVVEHFASMPGGDAEEVEVAEITNLIAKINGDAAVVTYMADGQEEQLDLVKVDGKWLVNISIDDWGNSFDEAEEAGEVLEGALGDVDEVVGEIEEEKAE